MQRFMQIAELIRKRVEAGVITEGDKLPSVRRLASETGVSVVTVCRAYELLESQGVCHARDRSGFYLSNQSKPGFHPRSIDVPVMQPDDVRALDQSPTSLQFHTKAGTATLPSAGLIDTGFLDKSFRRALLRSQADVAHPHEADEALTTAILQRSARREFFPRRDQVLITRSAMEAFNLCLDSLATSGSPVLVESPSFYPVLESLRHRGIKALEIYSHPQLGIDPEQFEHVLRSTGVKLSVLMGNNRFPTGVSYSRSTLQRLVQAAQRHQAVIIENDMAADLSYGGLRSFSLKEFDSEGHVVQFGGTVGYLSTAYEIGWILAGKHTEMMSANRQLNGTHLPHPALQACIGEYLAGRQLERDLKCVREALEQRMKQGLELVRTAVGNALSVSAPGGGYLCWVRGPRHFDAMKLARIVDQNCLEFIPGPFWSPVGSFSNFLALNFSAAWTPDRTRKLHRLMEIMLNECSIT